MSNSGSALASLTATYTDSEGEGDHEDNSLSDAGSESGKSPSNENGSEGSDRGSDRPISPVIFSSVTVATRTTTLVSYHDDTIASDEGEGGQDDADQRIIFLTDNDQHQEDVEMTEEDGVIIPPEPPGSCSAELQDKILKMYRKMEAANQTDMNAAIQKRKAFRNPSIYEKLVQFCGLNEMGTNYPPSIYDPLKWDKESYYEELAKVQKTEMDKREKDRKGKAEAATKKLEDEAANKRKTKWDMPAAGNAAGKASVAPPTLSTTVTGTKSTVISAFGSLPKKVKS